MKLWFTRWLLVLAEELYLRARVWRTVGCLWYGPPVCPAWTKGGREKVRDGYTRGHAVNSERYWSRTRGVL